MDEREYGKMWSDVAGRCKVVKVSHLQPACYVEIKYKGEFGEVEAVGFSKCQYPDGYSEKNGRDVAFVKAVGHAVGLLLIKRVNRLETDQKEIMECIKKRLEKLRKQEKRNGLDVPEYICEAVINCGRCQEDWANPALLI